MSNAIGQSATQLATSVAVLPEAYPFDVRLNKIAQQKLGSSGITLERQMLVRNKLFSALCADYRAHFCQIYSKTDKFPQEVVDAIHKAVDSYITSQLNKVHTQNVISYRRAFHHNYNKSMVTERVIVTGENLISLQEQHLGINLFIGNANRRLTDLDKAGRLTDELEKDIREQITRCEATKAAIEAKMKNLEQLQSK